MRELFSRLVWRYATSSLYHLKFSTRSSHVLKKSGERWGRGWTCREGVNLKLLVSSGLGRPSIFAHHRPAAFYRHSPVVGQSGRKLCENWQSDGKRSTRNDCDFALTDIRKQKFYWSAEILLKQYKVVFIFFTNQIDCIFCNKNCKIRKIISVSAKLHHNKKNFKNIRIEYLQK